MSPVGLANTRISTGYAQESPRSLLCTHQSGNSVYLTKHSFMVCKRKVHHEVPLYILKRRSASRPLMVDKMVSSFRQLRVTRQREVSWCT